MILSSHLPEPGLLSGLIGLLYFVFRSYFKMSCMNTIGWMFGYWWAIPGFVQLYYTNTILDEKKAKQYYTLYRTTPYKKNQFRCFTNITHLFEWIIHTWYWFFQSKKLTNSRILVSKFTNKVDLSEANEMIRPSSLSFDLFSKLYSLISLIPNTYVRPLVYLCKVAIRQTVKLEVSGVRICLYIMAEQSYNYL